ncbi:hypothetical protein ABTQ08_20710, partial [Acinetobacter baumannii]
MKGRAFYRVLREVASTGKAVVSAVPAVPWGNTADVRAKFAIMRGHGLICPCWQRPPEFIPSSV